MTTLTLNIKDERKVEDVLRFLRDIDFLDVFESGDKSQKSPHKSLLGSLSRFSSPDRIQEESDAWYRASGEKHDSD